MVVDPLVERTFGGPFLTETRLVDSGGTNSNGSRIDDLIFSMAFTTGWNLKITKLKGKIIINHQTKIHLHDLWFKLLVFQAVFLED